MLKGAIQIPYQTDIDSEESSYFFLLPFKRRALRLPEPILRRPLRGRFLCGCGMIFLLHCTFTPYIRNTMVFKTNQNTVDKTTAANNGLFT